MGRLSNLGGLAAAVLLDSLTRDVLQSGGEQPVTQRGSVLAVVGAQYGSEGKGVIVHHLADRYQVHVRTGGPNAGHSFYHQDTKCVQQIVPCGWTNPKARLVIGRGALVNPDLLLGELQTIEQFGEGRDVRDRLFIDRDAGVLSPWHHEAEGGVYGELHRAIGSTGEGVGAARLDRIRRIKGKFLHIGDLAEQPEHRWLGPMICTDTPGMLDALYREGKGILLEGTQGSGLSLIHGPWPFTTSHDTNAATLAADAGIPPHRVRTLLVARTYPIRVAGNSGPLQGELTWDDISRRVGRPVQERTTVTRKVRRIGCWDSDLFRRALVLNDPASVAITFMDYHDPKCEGKTTLDDVDDCEALRLVHWIEREFRYPVSLVGTGGPQWSIVERGPI